MKASTRALGPSAVELRVHPEGSYGEPWTWGCVASPKAGEPQTAWLTLALRAPGPDERKAAAAALKALGYTHVQWERIDRSGARRTRAFRL